MRKTPYQNCPRIATFLCRIFFCLLCGGIILSGAGDLLLAAPRVDSRTPRGLFQSDSASHLFLQPALETSLALLTHTLDARIATNDDRSLTLHIEAEYRLHNRERKELTATLLVAQPAAAAGRPLPRNIALTIDGQPLALQPAGEAVGQSVQVEFDADARRRLTLRYELPLSATQTFSFRYPISKLRSWPTDVNGWRVTIDFADSEQWLAQAESWLQIAPGGWDLRASRLQWLREESLPGADILFQALHPQRIQEIRALQDEIRAYNEPDSMQRLGDLYAQLYQAPEVNTTARERFYGQALAAYTQALRLGEELGWPDASLATMRYRLAALYRMRAIAPNGSVDSTYVALMMAEAEQALPALAQVETRQELQNWLAQGLHQKLRAARLQGNWSQALLLTDRLARLPADVVDPAALEAERRSLLLQEALQQLQDGNEDAAVALVGAEIQAGDVLPSPAYRALFANWQITITLSRNALSVDALAHPISQRRVDAESALNRLLERWQASGVDDAILTQEADGFHIRLARLDARTRRLLVENTPRQSDWALLRSVFMVAEQDTWRETHLLWQRTTQAIDVDFQAAGDQWHSMAAALESEAAAATVEQGVTMEIRQSLRSAQHLLEAARWRRLVSDSAVQVVIGESPDAASPQRVWLLSLTDAPQTLSAQTESVSALRLWLAVILGILLSSVFAGVLWLLL